MKIAKLFDPSRDIYRTIEKVITYDASHAARLRAEITEYVVTDSIEGQFEKLLSTMQTAMGMGGENEIGVWVSGFYGSGKSSFTKYLGLALDDSVIVDGEPFLKHLQDRMSKPQTKALLAAVAKKFPAAVILLDLASEMVAGATMEDVSTVLYYKVLQWAGYSRNLKVAALERRLKRDGRYEEFVSRIEADLGTSWVSVQNDPLVIDSKIPELAHYMYPELFKTPGTFSTDASDTVRFENERVKEMVDIVREASGKQYILFIIDEVGQYVGSRSNLILNLDGLAKNLKAIGDGKVWIVGTAQQMLVQDDERAALNSPELYKLKDRFPIQIDLESSDIKEICYRRLLGKSREGERILSQLFDKCGQALRQNAKLEDAKYYDADFDKTSFINLYPFLPAHFDILLHLLGALAKSTGGIGLRSAIKIIQDILIEASGSVTPAADQPIGWLATMVTLYDALEKDIRSAFASVHGAVGKVGIRFPDSEVHQDIAKTVAVLQILGTVPVTQRNIAGLVHPAVDAPSRFDDVVAAINDLRNDAIVPFGEREGNLCFFSERIREIDQERAQVPLRTVEIRRIESEALREVFSPLPSVRIDGTLTVKSGIKVRRGNTTSGLDGQRETVQIVIELVDAKEYENSRERVIAESRERSSQSTILWLGRTSQDIEDTIADVCRCNEIVQLHRGDPDQETREYCSDQSDRATKLMSELVGAMSRCLARGSFAFRGQATAVEGIDSDISVAVKKLLSEVAEQVFARYSEAPVRADTSLAEKFLRARSLRSIASDIDPLGLVRVTSGAPSIHTDHKALVSVRDYIDQNGTVDGKRLIGHFTEAPFGWSQDTLRYLIAALLLGGEIKLKVSGREVTVTGQQAIDALRTNNAFKKAGVALRDDRPSTDVLARAAKRLEDLLGDRVSPLEDQISKAAAKQFSQYQHRFGSLAEKLEGLGVPGAERLRSLSQELDDILLADASDAPQRLGAEQSVLYDDLKWAMEVSCALTIEMETTVRDIQRHRKEINELPNSGVPGELRAHLAEELAKLGEHLSREDFYTHAVELDTLLTAVKARTRDAAARLTVAQRDTIGSAQQALQRLPEWSELTREEQSSQLSQLDDLAVDVSSDLDGLNSLVSLDYVVTSHLGKLREHVKGLALERCRERLEQEEAKAKEMGRGTIPRSVSIPATVTNVAQLDELIRKLEVLRTELSVCSDIEVKMKIEEQT